MSIVGKRHDWPQPTWVATILMVLVTVSQIYGQSVTFNRDVASILFQNCSPCHRPGMAAPFSLLTYSDARKHAHEIVDVTQRRYMPPWLPDPSCGHFIGERLLSKDRIRILTNWVDGGLVEGSPSDLPPAPAGTDGWQLGPPDLIVNMSEPYLLAADGKDVYRNFVVPIPLKQRRFVRGIEFHPGNPRVVHHAFVNVDSTRKSRGLASGVTPPSFSGMDLPDTAVMPGGQMLGWQPGKAPYFCPDGLSWVLEPGTDMVLQIHMHPSGRVEPVQSSVGIYFTDIRPTNAAYRLELVRFDLEIPPDSTNTVYEQTYVLPVDVQLLAVSPHTHYLGKELEGFAILPDGRRQCLIRIPDWDFNWQGDYRLAEPISLPRNTTLQMRYRFDNSTNNVRNPNHPPKTVRYGLQTTDEMAELWFQVLPKSAVDGRTLGNDYLLHRRQYLLSVHEARVQANPKDGEAHLKMGSALMFLGRDAEAFDHFLTAARLLPENDQAHYELGYQYVLRNQFLEAQSELELATRLNPRDSQAFGLLGIAQAARKNIEQARKSFEAALQLNPDDNLARKYLNQINGVQ